MKVPYDNIVPQLSSNFGNSGKLTYPVCVVQKNDMETWTLPLTYSENRLFSECLFVDLNLIGTILAFL